MFINKSTRKINFRFQSVPEMLTKSIISSGIGLRPYCETLETYGVMGDMNTDSANLSNNIFLETRAQGFMLPLKNTSLLKVKVGSVSSDYAKTESILNWLDIFAKYLTIHFKKPRK